MHLSENIDINSAISTALGEDPEVAAASGSSRSDVDALAPRLAVAFNADARFQNYRSSEAWGRLSRIGNEHSYSLRHPFASRALPLSETLPIIVKLLGHSDIETTLRCAHLAHDLIHDVAEPIAESIATYLL